MIARLRFVWHVFVLRHHVEVRAPAMTCEYGRRLF
jgi:hypothetical protein